MITNTEISLITKYFGSNRQPRLWPSQSVFQPSLTLCNDFIQHIHNKETLISIFMAYSADMW